MRTVHVVLPVGTDDPSRPSGGNVYDRRVSGQLAATGWRVQEHAVAGAWPRPDAAARAALGAVLAALPDQAVVLVDGLVGSPAPEMLVPAARRLRVVVLVHMPLGTAAERAVLASAAAVVTTSAWTRTKVLDESHVPAERVVVAEPGADAADLATGSPSGTDLLCVAAVVPAKGHDLLVAALAAVAELPWRCVCVGSLNRDPAYVARLVRRTNDLGLADRVVLAGPRTGAELATSYATANALVLATRSESYGMVVTEALARGLPVIATRTGGVPEALGRAPDGRVPGLLVPPADAAALAGALRRWLTDDELRSGLRSAARARRTRLAGWPQTAERIAQALSGVAA